VNEDCVKSVMNNTPADFSFHLFFHRAQAATSLETPCIGSHETA